MCKKYLIVFLQKPCFLPPQRAIKTKTVEKVTNIWYNVLAYPARSVKQKSNSRKEITENDQKEIVDAVSASAGVSKKDTAAVIDSLLAAITDAVVKGDSVRFTGFGTFESRKRPARTGHNPATGATINIPASTVPAFKAGKAFKDALKK